MQTFLPVADFVATSKCLDYRRLGKQRLEAMQLIKTTELLENDDYNLPAKMGWVNHPARKMWVGYLDALKLYCNVMIDEWVSRGYKNTMLKYTVPSNIIYPTWFGDDKFHSSHRSNLLRKDNIFYSKFNWKEGPDLPYYWPV